LRVELDRRPAKQVVQVDVGACEPDGVFRLPMREAAGDELVLTRSWPVQRYGAFIADAMIAALL